MPPECQQNVQTEQYKYHKLKGKTIWISTLFTGFTAEGASRFPFRNETWANKQINSEALKQVSISQQGRACGSSVASDVICLVWSNTCLYFIMPRLTRCLQAWRTHPGCVESHGADAKEAVNTYYFMKGGAGADLPSPERGSLQASWVSTYLPCLQMGNGRDKHIRILWERRNWISSRALDGASLTLLLDLTRWGSGTFRSVRSKCAANIQIAREMIRGEEKYIRKTNHVHNEPKNMQLVAQEIGACCGEWLTHHRWPSLCVYLHYRHVKQTGVIRGWHLSAATFEYLILIGRLPRAVLAALIHEERASYNPVMYR